MFNAAYKTNSGLTVQDVDMGVKYSYNKHTMFFIGEQEFGDVDVDDKHYADYVFDSAQDAIVLYDSNNVAFATIDNTDTAYEAYVLQLLQSL